MQSAKIGKFWRTIQFMTSRLPILHIQYFQVILYTVKPLMLVAP